jgi:spore coat protein A
MHDRMANIVKGSQDYIFPYDQRAATLWYHDHRMDFTGPQLWRGLAGFYILRDDEEARLPLPNGDKEIALRSVTGPLMPMARCCTRQRTSL